MPPRGYQEEEAPIRLSVLDRLVQGDRALPHDAFAYEKSRTDLRAGLMRDLEWLFNTRVPVHAPPPGATELEDSVYNFGLPDLCTMNLSNVGNRSILAQVMEAAVAKFEKRLMDVTVTPLPAPAGGLPRLNFTIEATMLVEPLQEQVSFDAVLNIADGEYRVGEL